MRGRLLSENGQTLVWVAVGLVVLLGITALAIDGGNLYLERRRMQNAADAGALAGAGELCKGSSYAVAVTQAVALANEYAITRNNADWATPVPSQTTVGGKKEIAMAVTAGETVNNFFGGILGASSTTVSAYAKARCEKTTTGCGTWPLTLDTTKFNGMECGEEFVISLEQNPYGHDVTTGDPIVCPSGCDCSHVFVGLDRSPQIGWLGCDNKIDIQPGENDCDEIVWTVPQCLDAKPGADVGMVGGGGAYQALKDWIAAGNPPARLPLFECFDCNPCTGSEKYKIVGFGCLTLVAADPWDNQNYALPSLPDQTCSTTIDKVIKATVDCTCSISCGTGGGLPDPHDATIPVLVQ